MIDWILQYPPSEGFPVPSRIGLANGGILVFQDAVEGGDCSGFIYTTKMLQECEEVTNDLFPFGPYVPSVETPIQTSCALVMEEIDRLILKNPDWPYLYKTVDEIIAACGPEWGPVEPVEI